VTLSDLAKYSVTRNVARSLCDSWASCFIYPLAFDTPVRESRRNIFIPFWCEKN